MKNLNAYINNPTLMGRNEEASLTQLRERFPYFQALHILIAKSQKNQNAFGFNKSLKMASLYAGDRKFLYSFINQAAEIKSAKPKEEPIKPEEKVASPAITVKGRMTPEKLDAIFGYKPDKESELVLKQGKDVFEVVKETVSKPMPQVELKEKIRVENLPEKETVSETNSQVLLKAKTETSSPAEHVPPILKRPETEITVPVERKDRDLDFYAWLDNFTQETTDAEVKKEGHLFPAVHEKSEEDLKPESIAAQETEEEVVYDPAAWAEIAYDIQAFVKTSEPEIENEALKRQNPKDEIDDLLDRFIKKNPSISRVKTEFFKPENMARKSEEFHTDVASESLANVFFKQGHLHKSLEIYEKLILQNPDKKDIFAARIKSIKEELINRL